MPHDEPRYNVVNSIHAKGYPAITREEAGKAAKCLIRHFGRIEDACASRTVPMWKTNILINWTDSHKSGARRVWVSPKPTFGFDKGWGRLIHDVAHMIYLYRHPGQRPHGHGESQIEEAVAVFVYADVDWLKGTLKSQPKPKENPLEALELRLQRWQTKLSRAENAIRKINRKIAYHRRKHEVRET